MVAAASEFPVLSWNLDTQVLEVFVARLIMHFSEMERHRPDRLYVIRIH